MSTGTFDLYSLYAFCDPVDMKGTRMEEQVSQVAQRGRQEE